MALQKAINIYHVHCICCTSLPVYFKVSVYNMPEFVQNLWEETPAFSKYIHCSMLFQCTTKSSSGT